MLQFSTGQLVFLLVLAVVFGTIGYLLSENDRRRFGRTPWGLPSGIWALFWFLSMLLGLILYLIAHADVVRRARQFPDGRFPEAPGPYGASAAGPVGVGTLSPPKPPSASELFPAYPRPANGVSDPASGGAPPTPGIGTSAPASSGPGSSHPDSSGYGPSAQSGGPDHDAGDTTEPSASTAPAGRPDAPTVVPTGQPPTADATAGAVSPPAWHPDPSGRFHYRWWDGSQWTSYVSLNGQQLIDTSPDQRIGPY